MNIVDLMAVGKRLDRYILPYKYSLKFFTDINRDVFDCEEIISIKVNRGSRVINANSRDLKIKSAYVISKGKKYRARVKVDKRYELVSFVFDKKVYGDADLHIDFSGIHSDKLYGFYKSVYEKDGKKKHLLTTQFEPADARSAFVCFDEPLFKAVFELSVVVDNDLAVISNTPISTVERLEHNKKIVRFVKTPRMSTYLLYIGVGEFERISTKLDGVEIGAVTVGGKVELSRMALDFTKRFLKFYQDYFGIKFPLPKLDVIGIPDFSSGAMENWGAVTFRETEMLGTDKGSSQPVKQRIAEVISHELAHQWFGDLVTMEWWNDLWLNESFATFMSYKAMDHVFPKWNIMTRFLTYVGDIALVNDSRTLTHPIEVKVNTPYEISSIFDSISYEKGATVLHMIESHVGKGVFRAGLHRYLSENKYGNATGMKLWGSINTEAKRAGLHIDVIEFAKSWIKQKGYPIVTIREAKDGILLKQDRYTISGIKRDKQIWRLPLDYIVDGKGRPTEVEMRSKELLLRLNRDSAIKLNYNQNYMYRVRYPTGMLYKLLEYVEDGRFDPLDVWGIENDLFALTVSGFCPLDRYLEIVERYLESQPYPANSELSGHMFMLYNMLKGRKINSRVIEIIKRVDTNIIDQVGWDIRDGESPDNRIMRIGSFNHLGELGVGGALSRAERAYSQYKGGKDVKHDLLLPSLSIIAANGDKDVFNEIFGLYKNEISLETKYGLLGALARFNDERLIRKALDISLSKYVKLQDMYQIPVIAGSDSAIGPKIILDWIKPHWKEILDKCAPSTRYAAYIIESMSSLSNRSDRDDFYNFFSKRENTRSDIQKVFYKTLESINRNIRFFEINGL